MWGVRSTRATFVGAYALFYTTFGEWSRCPRPFSRLHGHFVGCAYHWLKGTSEAGFGDGISIFRRISPEAMRLRATEMLLTLMMDTPGS